MEIKELQSKIIEFPNAWNRNRLNKVRAGTQNIAQLCDNVFRFTKYNILPKNNIQLDGHYYIYMNYKTFNWRVIQNSYWGSLTYTTPPKNRNILSKDNLNDTTIKYIESLIADKLLGAYYYKFENGKENKIPLFYQCRSMIYKNNDLNLYDKKVVKMLTDNK